MSLTDKSPASLSRNSVRAGSMPRKRDVLPTPVGPAMRIFAPRGALSLSSALMILKGLVIMGLPQPSNLADARSQATLMSSAWVIAVRQTNASTVLEMDFEVSRALMNAVHLDTGVTQSVQRISERPTH